MVVRPSTNPVIVLVTSPVPLLTLASTSSIITLKHPMLKESRMLQAHMLSKKLVRQSSAEQLPSTLQRVCISTWCRTFHNPLRQASLEVLSSSSPAFSCMFLPKKGWKKI